MPARAAVALDGINSSRHRRQTPLSSAESAEEALPPAVSPNP
jgi:hypothetical protein